MTLRDAPLGPKRGALVCLLLLTNACAEGILSGGGSGNKNGDGNKPPSSGGDGEHLDDSPGGVNLTCDAELELSPTPLLKLSTVQYKNTVRDLLTHFDLASIAPDV